MIAVLTALGAIREVGREIADRLAPKSPAMPTLEQESGPHAIP